MTEPAGAQERRTEEQERRAQTAALWTEGRYEDIGELFEPISQRIVDDLDLDGATTLDAATGTGNTALAAARAGATVEAFDLAPRLLEVARAHARAQGLTIRFQVADLLELPYPDDTFDHVLSTFGAFTVDDPRRCLSELVRVCRPGGQVTTTAWANEGMFAEAMDVLSDHEPTLRDPHRADPNDWADPDALQGFLRGMEVDLTLEHRTAWFHFPSVTAAFELLEEASGPFLRLRASIDQRDPVGWSQVRDATLERWSALARSRDGGIDLPAVYGIATIRTRLLGG